MEEAAWESSELPRTVGSDGGWPVARPRTQRTRTGLAGELQTAAPLFSQFLGAEGARERSASLV